MKGRAMKRLNTLFLWPLIVALSVPTLVRAEENEDEGQSLPRVANANWKAECASCHTLYHPGLLPERSWRKLMSGLDKHFGENASLDPPTQQEITDFLVKHSAGAGSQYAKAVPASATPLRITETAWFKREHREVRADVWKRPKVGSTSNCMACHKSAEQGDFSEHGVSIPR
jgi:hypothetical protein